MSEGCSELRSRHRGERTVPTAGVEKELTSREGEARIAERLEPVLIETFVAHEPVAALNRGVLIRLPRLDEHEFNSTGRAPVGQGALPRIPGRGTFGYAAVSAVAYGVVPSGADTTRGQGTTCRPRSPTLRACIHRRR